MKWKLVDVRTQFTKILSTIFLTIMTMQPTLARDKPLKIGTKVGPVAQILEVVKQEAAKQGLNIQVVTFNDVRQPLSALAVGDLDVNWSSYQSRVDKFNAKRRYKHKLVSIAKTWFFRLGIYSKKVKHLDELPLGATIAIPNDPVNGGRALLLLQERGLIKLNPEAGLEASPLDIIENPKQIEFKELDMAQLPRSLDDTDASGITTNFAIDVGLNPDKDAIALESKSDDSPYVAVFVVREQDRKRDEWKQVLNVYRSQAVKDFILSTFKGAVLP